MKRREKKIVRKSVTVKRPIGVRNVLSKYASARRWWRAKEKRIGPDKPAAVEEVRG
jgi:hypothetical protein